MKLVVGMIEMNKNSELSLYELLDRLEKKNVGLKIFYFAMGLLIGAFAFNLFFEPYNVIPTGTSGLGLLLSNFINIDVAIIVLVINLILLIVGLLFFGYEYAIKIDADQIYFKEKLKYWCDVVRGKKLKDGNVCLGAMFHYYFLIHYSRFFYLCTLMIEI